MGRLERLLAVGVRSSGRLSWHLAWDEGNTESAQVGVPSAGSLGTWHGARVTPSPPRGPWHTARVTPSSFSRQV